MPTVTEPMLPEMEVAHTVGPGFFFNIIMRKK